MNRSSFSSGVLALTFLLGAALAAHAQVLLVGSSNPAGATIDLNDSEAFVAYQDLPGQLNGQTFGVGLTDANNVGGFTNLASNGGLGTDSSFGVTYTDASYSDDSQSGTGVDSQSPTLYTIDGSAGQTGSSELFSTGESFNFYVTYRNPTTFTLTLTDASGDFVSSNHFTTAGSSSTSGLSLGLEETVLVSGAVGDILTFSEAGARSGEAGINAITIDAVPEPSTGALLLGGVGLLALVHSRARRLLA